MFKRSKLIEISKYFQDWYHIFISFTFIFHWSILRSIVCVPNFFRYEEFFEKYRYNVQFQLKLKVNQWDLNASSRIHLQKVQIPREIKQTLKSPWGGGGYNQYFHVASDYPLVTFCLTIYCSMACAAWLCVSSWIYKTMSKNNGNI